MYVATSYESVDEKSLTLSRETTKKEYYSGSKELIITGSINNDWIL